MRNIHLMRHGEVHNPQKILYGRMPGYHLSALGRDMAQMTADYLTDVNAQIAAVISSPLERAQESAAPIARAYDLQIETDTNLIEAGNEFEGAAINASRWQLAYPRNWKRYVNPLRPSWGEAYSDIAARMVQAVRDALAHHPQGDIVLVSHQLPIWCLRLFVERRHLAHDPRMRECALASLTTLQFEGKTLVGVSYCEPASELLPEAADMVPGTSEAQLAD